ncbi:MAG: type II toxin-antitoxin system RelE/ParE family toxin [Gemmatimonadota bacterium]
MIRSFRSDVEQDVFNGRSTKAGRRFASVWKVARRKLEMLDSARTLADLRAVPGNRLEALRGNRQGQYSIRINDQYRVAFRWTPEGPEDVEITDYH